MSRKAKRSVLTGDNHEKLSVAHGLFTNGLVVMELISFLMYYS